MKIFDPFNFINIKTYFNNKFILVYIHLGATGDWDFWLSDLVKGPDGTDI